jgi:hypothetical protein
MNFNIDEVIAQMLNAIKGEVQDNWSLVKDTASDFLQNRRLRLDLLTSLRLQQQISEQFYEGRLADEKDILASELHAIAIISKVTAQNAANAAIAVLQKAVTTAIGLG